MFTIIFFGKTGAGKSTTINNLFGLNWATDAAVACTKEPQVAILDQVSIPDLPIGHVRVVDMPGIGESIDADKTYLPYYEQWLPKADVLVWVTQADTRAYKRDEIFLDKLSPLFHPSLKFVVALNRIDHLGVDEANNSFDFTLCKPSIDQMKALETKIDDIFFIFRHVLPEKTAFNRNQITPYTAIYGWGLTELKSNIYP